VDEILGGLREVPLQVAAQPRVVVEDAQGQRTLPLAAGGEHLERAVVEIEVPQGTDVLRFVAADLTLFATLLRAASPGWPWDAGFGLRTMPWACMYRRTVT